MRLNHDAMPGQQHAVIETTIDIHRNRHGRESYQALDWPMSGYEDALHAAAAAACGAQAIITRNIRDFKGSPIPAMTPETFVRLHIPALPVPRLRRPRA